MAAGFDCWLARLLDFDKTELDSERTLYLSQFMTVDASQARAQTLFGDGCDLISHGLGQFAMDVNIGFAWIQPINIGSQRNHLNAVQCFVRSVVAGDDNRSGFSDFPTDGWIKTNTAHFTTAHGLGQ